MTFLNKKTLLQLKDLTMTVSNCKDKLAMSQMFNVELKFAFDCLLLWLNKKVK